MARIVARVLARKGYRVTTAGDGHGAEAALTRAAFDVVLLDLDLPDTPGQVLLARWSQTLPGTQVIVLTANREIATAVACVKAGAFDYLVKPVDPNLLLTTIEGATRAPRRDRRPAAS